MTRTVKLPDKVRNAIERALADIREGVVSFDADEYEPVIAAWLDELDEQDDTCACQSCLGKIFDAFRAKAGAA